MLYLDGLRKSCGRIRYLGAIIPSCVNAMAIVITAGPDSERRDSSPIMFPTAEARPACAIKIGHTSRWNVPDRRYLHVYVSCGKSDPLEEDQDVVEGGTIHCTCMCTYVHVADATNPNPRSLSLPDATPTVVMTPITLAAITTSC
jgi:hypothetical protein